MALPRYSWRNIHPRAKCHYIRDVKEANLHVASLRGPVGFDLEWKPTFTKGAPLNRVALIQLANKDKILVIQVSAMPEFPAKLRKFLEDPDIVKAGCGIQFDVKKLYEDFNVSAYGCVDLSIFARSLDQERWQGRYSNPGLHRLVEAYENRVLLKEKDVTLSDWEAKLNSEQIEYACNDAHAGFVIFEKFMGMAIGSIPSSSSTREDYPVSHRFGILLLYIILFHFIFLFV